MDKHAQKKSIEEGIHFVCQSDAADNPNHQGWWIELKKWNRYRHYWYKDRRDDEAQYVPAPADLVAVNVAVPVNEAASLPGIKDPANYELVSSSLHKPKKGPEKFCEYWLCKQRCCKAKGPIKQIGKSTGQLFKHLKFCNYDLWIRLRLKSNHSKLTVRRPPAPRAPH